MKQMTHTAIAGALEDVLLLEREFEAALAGQLRTLMDEPGIARELRQVHSACERHIEALELMTERSEERVPGVKQAMKRGALAVRDAGEAVTAFLHTEQLARDIREDYTTIAAATISYVALHTMGMALGDEEVAELARLHLRDYARGSMTLHNIAPSAVLRHLVEDGQPADASVLPDIEENILDVWRVSAEPVSPPMASRRSLAR
ncbi:MAG: hypothetical protein U0132_04145 [Gemmatimonadaceae bacterium]